MLIMEKASEATASVSGVYSLIQTASKVDLTEVIEQDIRDLSESITR
jgi:hypothetical protein